MKCWVKLGKKLIAHPIHSPRDMQRKNGKNSCKDAHASGQTGKYLIYHCEKKKLAEKYFFNVK